MKTWVYQIVWKKGRKHLHDGTIYRDRQVAITTANISSTQMEFIGWDYGINTVELV